jgi:hypothetical protein
MAAVETLADIRATIIRYAAWREEKAVLRAGRARVSDFGGKQVGQMR